MNNNLNTWNENTKGIIHLLVTPLCNRNCKYCCNKQYDMNTIPIVSEEELRAAHTLCLTGGEPFAYANPVAIAKYYKFHYSNIEHIYVYTNAVELYRWLVNNDYKDCNFSSLDGLNISIKSEADLIAFDLMVRTYRIKTPGNRLYVFDNLWPQDIPENFEVFKREWQKDFVPANDSIFRRI